MLIRRIGNGEVISQQFIFNIDGTKIQVLSWS